jgi:hypothetical protein
VKLAEPGVLILGYDKSAAGLSQPRLVWLFALRCWGFLLRLYISVASHRFRSSWRAKRGNPAIMDCRAALAVTEVVSSLRAKRVNPAITDCRVALAVTEVVWSLRAKRGNP